jgi:aspartate aminotransferase/aminotransferase
VGQIRELVRREEGVEAAVLVTSGVSGGLLLSLLATVNPGEEVLFLDPYFVSYLQLTNLIGGKAVPVSSYPDFRFRRDAVEAAITPRTKAILINSPANPTGRVMTSEEVEAAAELAQRHNLVLISDEIYEQLSYDGGSPSPLAMAPENTVVLRGFGKTYGITGWRMGYAVGPAAIIEEMTKFHQYTYVCAPSMAQFATLTALKTDVSDHLHDYARKRDLVCNLLESRFEIVRPGGGFYVFPRVPDHFSSATQFCEAAAQEGVLVIPGSAFSAQDTHFRISYATSDAMLRRGCEVLCRLASP